MDLSRRNFLKGATVAGAAGAFAGLVGCASTGGESTSAAAGAGSAASPAARPTGYMCDEDWLGAAPTVSDGDVADTKSFDVVVVGGGHAGTQAALAAAQEGASVAVIERHNDGEIVYRGDDICSYNSDLLAS